MEWDKRCILTLDQSCKTALASPMTDLAHHCLPDERSISFRMAHRILMAVEVRSRSQHQGLSAVRLATLGLVHGWSLDVGPF